MRNITILSIIFTLILSCTRKGNIILEGSEYYLKIEKKNGGETKVFVYTNDGEIHGYLVVGSKSAIDVIWNYGQNLENSILAILVLETKNDYSNQIKNDNILIYDLSNSELFYEKFFQKSKKLSKGLNSNLKREIYHINYY